MTTQKKPIDDDSIVVDDFDADDEKYVLFVYIRFSSHWNYSSKTKAGKRPRKVAKSRRVMDSDDEQEERFDLSFCTS